VPFLAHPVDILAQVISAVSRPLSTT